MKAQARQKRKERERYEDENIAYRFLSVLVSKVKLILTSPPF